MTEITVTVRLPETLYQQARETAAATSRSVEEVLTQSIALSLPPLEDVLPSQVKAELSAMMLVGDDELWQIARAELPAEKQERLEILTETRKERSLTDTESEEFDTLFSEAELTMLRRAEAYRLLTRRGYTIPWLE